MAGREYLDGATTGGEENRAFPVTILKWTLGVVALMGVSQASAPSVEAVFLGYDGGNQMGIYRLLVGGKILKLNRTGVTTIDRGQGGVRLQHG